MSRYVFEPDYQSSGLRNPAKSESRSLAFLIVPFSRAEVRFVISLHIDATIILQAVSFLPLCFEVSSMKSLHAASSICFFSVLFDFSYFLSARCSCGCCFALSVSCATLIQASVIAEFILRVLLSCTGYHLSAIKSSSIDWAHCPG